MFQLLLAIIYLAFISLGLPDAILGAAWPDMYTEFGMPLSYMGIISAIISAGTIISSLQSDRLTFKLRAGSVDASLNNYVALHYESRHMSWLHCMWGIGAALRDLT